MVLSEAEIAELFGGTVFKTAVAMSPAPADRIAVLRISTPDLDRKGHIVDPAGADLTDFLKNPLFMWNHEGYNDPTKIIGKALSITQSDEGLEATVQYHSFSTSPFANHIWELEKKGLLPGNSIGLMPVEVSRDEAGIYTFNRWRLLDISKVATGMNPNALTIHA